MIPHIGCKETGEHIGREEKKEKKKKKKKRKRKRKRKKKFKTEDIIGKGQREGGEMVPILLPFFFSHP